jgi:hypothetical protein
MNSKIKIGLFTGIIILIACSSGQNKNVASDKVINQIVPDYNIDFPKTDSKVEKTADFDNSIGVTITNWILQGEDQNGPFMFFVAHNVVPEKLKSTIEKEPKSLEVAFQAMLTSSATKLGGTDFSFSPIKYEKYEGMESLCKVFDGDGIIKSRVYMIENNIFMISAGGKKINIETVDKFLNSFGLKK